MTEEFSPEIKAAIEIGGLFVSRWERREAEPVLKEDVAAIILKHLPHPSAPNAPREEALERAADRIQTASEGPNGTGVFASEVMAILKDELYKVQAFSVNQGAEAALEKLANRIGTAATVNGYSAEVQEVLRTFRDEVRAIAQHSGWRPQDK